MLYDKPLCPVDDLDREWIEKALIWFEKRLGREFIRSREYLLLQYCNFKYQDFSSDDAIQYFVEFICNYIGLDPSIVEFRILVNDDIQLADGVKIKISNQTYDKIDGMNENGKFEIWVSSDTLKIAESAFIILAYELVYLKLSLDKVFTFRNGYMTDYAMVLFGFGIIKANCFIRSQQWQTVSRQGWGVRKIGFLNHRVYGYLFALLNKYRNDDHRFWQTYLCPDAKVHYDKAKAFLEDADDQTALFNDSRIEVSDEDVFIRKLFYANGKIQQLSHLKDDMLTGLTLFFHQNGKLWSERVYKNNLPFTVISNYDNDGDPLEKGTLHEGNGTLYIYNANGSLNIIETYKDGIKL